MHNTKADADLHYLPIAEKSQGFISIEVFYQIYTVRRVKYIERPNDWMLKLIENY